MRTPWIRLACAILLGALSVPSGAASQATTGAAGGAHYESYSFGDPTAAGVESLSLLTIPLGAVVRLGTRTDVRVNGAWARGTMTYEGRETRIEGPIDTEFAATFRLAGGRLAVTGVVLLPTGHATHTTDEAVAAAYFASDLLLFRTSNWGTGGGLGMRASASRRFGSLGAGVSFGYFQGRDFSPVDQSDLTYRPGNNVVARMALDRIVGASGKASLVLTYRGYDDDRLDGANLFRSGTRFQAIGSYAFAFGRRASGVVYGGGLRSSEGTFIGEAPPIAGRTFMVAGAGGRFRVGGAVVVPSVDFRALRASDGLGQGLDTRLGSAVELQIGSTTVVPSVRGHLGRLSISEGVESSVRGTEIAIAVRFGGGSS